MSMPESGSNPAAATVAAAIDDLAGKVTQKKHEAEESIANRDNAVRNFVREKPYTALAFAGLAGFLYAVIRRP
jgi:hypothetical protein